MFQLELGPIDHGHRVGHGLVHVALPDRVELDAHGYLIVGDDANAPVGEARIATNDTATYLVRYYQGDHQLYGNNVLSVVADPSVTAVRTFSISAGLAASTVTPGSTAPELSVTTPASVTWAQALAGTSRRAITPNVRNTRRIPSPRYESGLPGLRSHRRRDAAAVPACGVMQISRQGANCLLKTNQ